VPAGWLERVEEAARVVGCRSAAEYVLAATEEKLGRDGFGAEDRGED
jgi:hypothetical protein